MRTAVIANVFGEREKRSLKIGFDAFFVAICNNITIGRAILI